MDIVQLISNLGYPITSAVALLLALKYCYDKESAKSAEMHKEDCERLDRTIDKIGDLTIAVKENSESITRLVDRIKDDDDGK